MRGQHITIIMTIGMAFVLWVLAFPADNEPQFYEGENNSYTVSVRDAEPETVTEPTTTAAEPVKYIEEIPLNEEIQQFVFEIAEVNNVSPFLIFAVIEVESRYDANAAGDNGASIGLMQVQPKWHAERMQDLDVTNLYDPIDNIAVGVDFLIDCLESTETIEQGLVMYNTGERGEGNRYSANVIQKLIELEGAYGK